jgi:hypothetical protein
MDTQNFSSLRMIFLAILEIERLGGWVIVVVLGWWRDVLSCTV